MAIIFILIFGFIAFMVLVSFNFTAEHSFKFSDLSPRFKMAGKTPDGSEIRVNKRFIEFNGHPFIPIMGEFHYTRSPPEYWKEILMKMKSCGINTIATYVLWNHHEYERGLFNWEGRRNLMAFVDLCKRMNLFVWLRIGPFCHGEVRNGGVVEWWWNRSGKRSTDPEWLKDTERLYSEISRQVQGFLFKQGGPIIGIQLENEYHMGKKGIPYIKALKEIAIKVGLDVPIYSVTGWGRDATVPPYEVLPFYGSYADAPWDMSLTGFKPEYYSKGYFFNNAKESGEIQIIPISDSGKKIKHIGPDKSKYEDYIDYDDYPDFTCEIGGGNQITYHRRPLLSPKDIVVVSYTRIGSGVNLPGIYMFYGGTNPLGLGSIKYLQETMGRPSFLEYPIFSYDFQAPIREFGRLHGSYFMFKELFMFISSFESILAPSLAVLPERLPNSPDDTDTPRASLRSDGFTSFIFVNNYDRFNDNMHDIGNVQFKIRFMNKEEDTPSELIVPQMPITIPKDSTFILPVNLKMGNLVLKYSTTQPITFLEMAGKEGSPGYLLYFFKSIEGIAPEYVFYTSDTSVIPRNTGVEYSGILKVVFSHNVGYKKARTETGDGFIKVSPAEWSLHRYIDIYPNLKNEDERKGSGKIIRIVTLTEKESEMLWRVKNNIIDGLILSGANVYYSPDEICLEKTSPDPFDIKIIPSHDLMGSIRLCPETAVKRSDYNGCSDADGNRFKIVRENGNDINSNGLGRNNAMIAEYRILMPQTGDWPGLSEYEVIHPDFKAVSDEDAAMFIKDDIHDSSEGMLEIEGNYWSIALPKDLHRLFEEYSEIYLKVDFIGDIFRLYIGGRFVWDTYFCGESLMIGLSRWKDLLNQVDSRIIIEITPLERDADIYLEKEIEFPENADSINKLIDAALILERSICIK